MTMREFQVHFRRNHVVDILTPKRDGVQGYRFKASSTFSGSFTTILTADIGCGYLDNAVPRGKLSNVPNRDFVRVVFDPDTFHTVAGIEDSKQFWLTFTPIDFSGSAGPEGPPGLILPQSDWIGNNRVIIQGTAPAKTSLEESLELDLPCQMQDFRIINNESTGGSHLMVATTRAGGEHEYLPQADSAVSDWYDGAVDTLFVRGEGGTVSFSASFTPWLPL